jgi:hypothetical protein
MAGVQRGLAPGGLLSSRPSIPLSSHRLRSRWRVVRSRPRWRAMRGAVQPWAARRTAWARRPHPLFSLSPYPNLSLLGPFGEPHLKAAFQGLGHLAEGAEGVAEVQRV